MLFLQPSTTYKQVTRAAILCFLPGVETPTTKVPSALQATLKQESPLAYDSKEGPPLLLWLENDNQIPATKAHCCMQDTNKELHWCIFLRKAPHW